MKRFAVAAVLILSACARHDPLPPALDVTEPVAPINVSVETVDHVTFTVSWEDTSSAPPISYYTLYWKSEFTELAPAGTVEAPITAAQITTEGNVAIPGVVMFCVGSVSDEHVESILTCGSTE